MSITGSLTTPRVPPCDQDRTFSVLAGRARRKLLVALARGGPQIGADLVTAGRAYGSATTLNNFLSSTLKNLKPMVQAGVIVQLANSRDGRRPLYAISPAVKVTLEGELTVFDFGFCVVRLSADGN